jgi:hypothetical protein
VALCFSKATDNKKIIDEGRIFSTLKSTCIDRRQLIPAHIEETRNTMAMEPHKLAGE